MDVSIIILNYKTKHYLPRCLNAVYGQQTGLLFEIMLINNDVEENLNEFKNAHPRLILINNKKNVGFAKGNNIGIQKALGEFILCLNADVELSPNYLDALAMHLRRHKEVAGVTGKLLIYDEGGNGKTDILDSTGITIDKNRNAYDIGQGERNGPSFSSEREVFGISAAAALYRKNALENATIMGECFDEDFFAYKEDIDLSWRLRLFGWKFAFVPEAVAYHARTSGILPQKSSIVEVLKNRRRHHTKKLNYLSFRNHRFMLIKNEQWSGIIPALPRLAVREVAIIFYALVCEPYLLLAYKELLFCFPKMLRKRKLIQKTMRVAPNAIATWIR